MIAYVKIEFILILVLVGELRSYKMTIGPSDSDLFANNGFRYRTLPEAIIK